jgi:CheY-like chemotaxis protein
VKQILTFARRTEEQKIPLKTSLIVKEAVKFLRSTIPTTTDIRMDIKAKKDTVLADPTQMNEVVMNLCTNATQAMREKGGLLTISLTNEHVGKSGKSPFGNLESGNYLRMSVSDSGAGIAPDIIDKVFEPYFTTKGPGEGTGLGLAIIHGIVQNSGGHVAVESELGKGTTFHVMLPVIEAEAPLNPTVDIQIPRGRERVLCVDDEKTVVGAMQSMLERLGYHVTARANSTEALEVFRDDPEGIDLVITDMTMPNMTGKELARELISIRPDIPIILCTGFSEQIDESRAKKIGINAFMLKPVGMKAMADTIREVLDKRH